MLYNIKCPLIVLKLLTFVSNWIWSSHSHLWRYVKSDSWCQFSGQLKQQFQLFNDHTHCQVCIYLTAYPSTITRQLISVRSPWLSVAKIRKVILVIYSIGSRLLFWVQICIDDLQWAKHSSLLIWENTIIQVTLIMLLIGLGGQIIFLNMNICYW